MPESKKVKAQRLLQEADELLREGRSLEAVRAARESAANAPDPVLADFNLAAVLIDAGSVLRGRHTRFVREGIRLLRHIEDRVPENLSAPFHYNLGNAYSSLGQREQGFGAGTKPSLAEAVSRLDEAVSRDPLPDTRANLAGALMQQGRWLEAYDEFSEVLRESPNHHVSLARRGSCLWGIYGWTGNHKALLMAALSDHRAALKHAANEPVFQESYRRAIAELEASGIQDYDPTPNKGTVAQEWIWNNRLALNPCPVCRIESPDAFDLYPFPSRLEGGRRIPPTETLLDLVNAICQTFAVARWMLYMATSSPPIEDDHVISLEGSSGAIHDLPAGLTMAAVSGFYSVLNQISFAMNAAFDLGHSDRLVSLQRIWHPSASKKKGVPRLRSEIHPKLTRHPTPALSALHRLSLSLEHGLGRYEHLRSLRNSIEHHVVVAFARPTTSSYYVGVELADLANKSMELGRLAKAAIWYFGATLLRSEKERLKRAIRRGQVVFPGQGLSVQRR